MHFSGDIKKNSSFGNFRRFPEKRLWCSSFKQFELSNLSPITIRKTDSITNVSCESS